MMIDFLEGLEKNADRIISEAGEAGSGSGKTFADLAQGVKWGYIPQPKGASEGDAKSGKGGFGTAKNSLLFIKENSPDSWDIYVMKFAAGKAMASSSDKAAAAALRKRAPKTEAGKTDEAKEISKYMALTEQILSGKTLNEAAKGNVEGWTAMLDDPNWQVSKALTGLKFADLLEKCVAVVNPEAAGGAKSLVN